MIGVFARSQSALRGCLRTVANPTSRNVARSPRLSARLTTLLSSPHISRPFSSSLRLRDNIAPDIEPVPQADAVTADGAKTPQGELFVTKFSELGEKNLLAPTVVDTLTQDMGMKDMTPVQSQTISQCLDGGDVLAQARTGTGKTLAFLIPILQRIINQDPTLAHKRITRNKADIRALIISPTRELAEQIAVEARKVTANTGLLVSTAVGGTNKFQALRQLQSVGCHILVGTPGRLNDILSDPNSRVDTPNLQALVLDEADRLLDAGFGPEIQKIEKLLPNRKRVDRQTLMFSATVPEEVLSMVDWFMKPGYQFVQTIAKGEPETHERVPQKMVQMAGMENTIPALMELAKREIQKSQSSNDERPFKAIVFFNANAEASLAAATFEVASGPRGPRSPFHPAIMVEMHSRLTQSQRTLAAERFRKAKSGILFSSDVTARGMDFPDVTHVIQAGIPSTSDTYVHRLGRTARGNKTGEGWLFVYPVERFEVQKRLRGMKIANDTSLETAGVNMSAEAQLPASVAQTLTEAVQAAVRVPSQMKSDAYKASLGVYQWFPKKQTLLDMMNARARFGWGMPTPPGVPAGLVKKLGLSKLDGIQISADFERRPGPPGPPGRGYDRPPRPFPRARGFEHGKDFGRGGGYSRGGGGGGGYGREGGGYGRGDDSGRSRDSIITRGSRRYD